MAGHTAGEPMECYGIPIVLHKEPELDQHGNPVFDPDGNQKFRCGFKIGGGIDQDPAQSPQGYPDKGIYITFVYENGPAYNAGLQIHDKVLQVNNHDMTMVSHKKAIEYIKRRNPINMLVYRKGMPPPQKLMQQQQQPGYSPQPMQTQNGNYLQQQQFPQFDQFQPVQQAPGSPHHYRQY